MVGSRGFSLFEMVLALVVVSMLAVAGIKYTNYQAQSSAAEVYGQNLYLYGQAVRGFIYDNAQSINQFVAANHIQLPPNLTAFSTASAGPNGDYTLTFTNVQWLAQQKNAQGASYLPANFKIEEGISPLILKEGITTVIGLSTNPSSPLYSAPSISITTGMLYKSAAGGTAAIAPEFTAVAVKHANTFYTTYAGGGAIQYVYNIGQTTVTGSLTPLAQTNNALPSGSSQSSEIDSIQNTTSLVMGIQDIAAGIRNVYGSSGDYGALGTDGSSEEGKAVAPAGQDPDWANGVTPYNGTYTVGSVSDSPSSSFWIDVTGIPPGACLALVSAALAGGAQSACTGSSKAVEGSGCSKQASVAAAGCTGTNSHATLIYQ